MRIYVGNLSFYACEEDLRQLFAKHGTVGSVALVRDRETNRPVGHAYVRMLDDEQAKSAIAALNGHVLDDRRLVVNRAKPSRTKAKPNAAGAGR